MAETRPASKKGKNRGSLHSFYDPKLQESLYGKRDDKSKKVAPKVSTDNKRSALVPIAGGRFEIDRKVLLEECAADFNKAWFFESATRAITHRIDSSTLKVFNPKHVEYVPVDEESQVSIGKDLVSRVTQRFDHELSNVKPNNSTFAAPAEPRRSHKNVLDSSNSKTVTKPEGDEVRELFHNASMNNSIDTFVKRKYAASRVNLGLGMNSPDIILFRECLKKNVLPPGSLELEWKSADVSLHPGSLYDHQTSVHHLAQISSSLLGKTSVHTANSLDVAHNHSIVSADQTMDGHALHAHFAAEENNHTSGNHSIGSLDSSDILGIENEQIHSINLNNKGIGDERGICLSSALSYCPHLCVIKLSNNRLGDRALSMILNAVFNITYCEELDISSNTVGDISTKCLSAYLQVSHCALRKLNLRRCHIDDVNCAALCEALRHNESLEILDLSENNLGKFEELNTLFGKEIQGATAIADLLVNNSTLQELCVSNCSIHKQHAHYFAVQLSQNQSLRKLDLSHNDISDVEARALGKALHSHHVLTHLDLSYNNLSSKAAITVGYAAQLPESALQYVNLNGNSIGKLAGVYMLRAMRTVASYNYSSKAHHHGANSHESVGTIHTSTSTAATFTSLTNGATLPTTRRLLTIDYKVTLTQFNDDSILDTHHPHKSYSLHLHDPYDYTIARMLMDQADRHPTATFRVIKHLHPSSHLWEHIHLGRGGLFEHPADLGLTSLQVWNNNIGEINAAIGTLQAARIAEMQSTGAAGASSGARQGRRRQAFRAPVTRKSVISLDSPGSSPTTSSHKSFSAMLNATNEAAAEEPEDHTDTAKEGRQRARAARHVLHRVGAKLGFNFDENILSRIIDKLCLTSVEARAKFVTLLEIIYQEVFHALSENASTLKAQDEAMRMKIPIYLLADHMALFGVHKDTDIYDVIPAQERAHRLISECDLSEENVLLGQLWYLQIMLSRQIDTLAPTSRTYWAALNTTHHYQVPSEGILQIELNYPILCPTVHHVLSNKALLALLTQVSNNINSERAFDQIAQILTSTTNELYLTCIQAEIILHRFTKFKSQTHLALVESLLYQMVSTAEARRFVVRNLYFSEILSLRRKLNYLFKVLTGNVTGHYLLDLRNEQHRTAALRLAELNTFHQMQNLKRDIDTSQLGSRDCYRNASYNHAYLPLDSAWFQNMPDMGMLRFDYVSPVRAVEGTPPSAGTWGCSHERYNPTLAPEPPLPGEGEEPAFGNEDEVYNESAELNFIFSTLHGKEQFVQELVENLFAKRFEPRSRAKRKETRSCPKNMTPVVRPGAGWSSGKFVNFVAEGLENAQQRVSEMKRLPSAKKSFVDRMKSITADDSAGAVSAQAIESASTSGARVAFDATRGSTTTTPVAAKAMTRRSQLAHLQERKQLAALQPPVDRTTTEADKGNSSDSDSSEDDYFTRDDSESESTSSPSSPHSPHSPHNKKSKHPFKHLLPNHTGNEPVKKPRKAKVNKFMELYIAEVSEYWKDVAATSWVRCRAIYVETLKQRLLEGVAEEYKHKTPDKDINAAIPPGAYKFPAYLTVKNSPVFKSVGSVRSVRRRPGTAQGNPLTLSFSLHSTSLGGNSKKFSVALDSAEAAILAAGVESAVFGTNNNTSGKYGSFFGAGGMSSKSNKFVGGGASMKGGFSSKSGKLSSLNTAANAGAGTGTSSEEGSAAAVLAKMAFEKFLLRLEVVSMYNMWITTEQLNVILQALLSHSAPVSVITRSLCVLYNHVVDRAAFYTLVSSCQDQLRRELVHRLGLLNVWSPLFPDGKVELDLAAHDHREACRIMSQMLWEKGSLHELTEVVYFKDSILDTPNYLTTRNHLRSGTGSSPTAFTTVTFRAGASEKDPLNNNSHNNFNNNNNTAEDRLPLTWMPPEYWSKPDPQGPPYCGHLHFVFKSTAAPAYDIF